ncbi:hemin-degrading factor [Pararhodonellum marinum]|uniref:hemin-degrading factor n=1 Tax=Pararhodonellum marinum TaxID=2755358 RepID=UPI00188E9875|nr:ChuX/HutX family heme-like substrate-binding protein [Pararhodonellum marinum]
MESTLNQTSNTMLKAAWDALKAEQPHLRIRDAAKALEVSELELLATGMGPNIIRLKADWSEILLSCKELGKVMALTRNDGCVLEHKGNFQKISVHGTAPRQMATVIGPIEQRVFFQNWAHGFAVIQETPRGSMKSLQFFDGEGVAVLKIYLQEKSNLDAFSRLIQQFEHSDQSAEIELTTYDKPEYAQEIDMQAFTAEWEQMKDTHDFFGMLRKYKVHRLDAIKWIDDKWAREVDRLSARRILEVAAAEKMAIMVFVGNRGNIQIHQGKVRTIRQMGNWLNVMDPDFNMHLNEDCIHSAWVVHKHTEDGLVSSLELFDSDREMIAQFFGLRKPGLPQNERWKSLIDDL